MSLVCCGLVQAAILLMVDDLLLRCLHSHTAFTAWRSLTPCQLKDMLTYEAHQRMYINFGFLCLLWRLVTWSAQRDHVGDGTALIFTTPMWGNTECHYMMRWERAQCHF